MLKGIILKWGAYINNEYEDCDKKVNIDYHGIIWVHTDPTFQPYKHYCWGYFLL